MKSRACTTARRRSVRPSRLVINAKVTRLQSPNLTSLQQQHKQANTRPATVQATSARSHGFYPEVVRQRHDPAHPLQAADTFTAAIRPLRRLTRTNCSSPFRRPSLFTSHSLLKVKRAAALPRELMHLASMMFDWAASSDQRSAAVAGNEADAVVRDALHISET